MTFTIRRSTAVILIAFSGVLGGLAIGQVTAAVPASPNATASVSSESLLREISKELQMIRRGLIGITVPYQNIHDLIEQIDNRVR